MENMQPKCSQNTVKIQSKCNQNAAKTQPKRSQNAVKMQPKFSLNAVTFQSKIYQIFLYFFVLGNKEPGNYSINECFEGQNAAQMIGFPL